MLLVKALLLALNLLQTHAVYAHTFLGHAIRPEKIALSPRTAAEGGQGKAVCYPKRERCSLKKSCSQHFFFLGDVVLKEEPLRDAQLGRPGWGGEVLLVR